jgi:hypothetical protein
MGSVCIYEDNNNLRLRIIKEFLASHGIDSYIPNEHLNSLSPFQRRLSLLTDQDCADRAVELLLAFSFLSDKKTITEETYKEKSSPDGPEIKRHNRYKRRVLRIIFIILSVLIFGPILSSGTGAPMVTSSYRRIKRKISGPEL